MVSTCVSVMQYIFQASSLKPRLLNYKRATTKKGTDAATGASIDITMAEDIREGEGVETEGEGVETEAESVEEDNITDDLVEDEINFLNELCDKDDDDDEYCDDFLSEESAWCNIMMFARD